MRIMETLEPRIPKGDILERGIRTAQKADVMRAKQSQA